MDEYPDYPPDFEPGCEPSLVELEASELLSWLLKHFSRPDLCWSYVEDTPLREVDPELAAALQQWEASNG